MATLMSTIGAQIAARLAALRGRVGSFDETLQAYNQAAPGGRALRADDCGDDTMSHAQRLGIMLAKIGAAAGAGGGEGGGGQEPAPADGWDAGVGTAEFCRFYGANPFGIRVKVESGKTAYFYAEELMSAILTNRRYPVNVVSVAGTMNDPQVTVSSYTDNQNLVGGLSVLLNATSATTLFVGWPASMAWREEPLRGHDNVEIAAAPTANRIRTGTGGAKTFASVVEAGLATESDDLTMRVMSGWLRYAFRSSRFAQDLATKWQGIVADSLASRYPALAIKYANTYNGK